MKFDLPARQLLPGILLIFSSFASAQGFKPTTIESIDNTVLDREHVSWTSPESLLVDLRSANDEMRLKALKLAGLSDQQAHQAIWSDGHSEPAKVIAQSVVTPRRTQLMYAAIGDDARQQAIIAIDDGGQSLFAAVAVQNGNTWERIAVISCWCKYDMNWNQDGLAEFVSLRQSPETGSPKPTHYELVVHSSGGGTGVYSQTEAHFRVYRNELRSAISFTSAYRNGTAPVTIERRWFTFAPVPDGTLRGVLVEAKGSWPPDNSPPIQWEVRALLDRHLGKITCTAHRWDEKTFRYARTNEVVPTCQSP
jgi:hypothetical protein